MVAGVELTYNINASAQAMAEAIFGDGVTVVPGGASFTGDRRASAIYSDGDSISPGVTPSDTGVISAFTSQGPSCRHGPPVRSSMQPHGRRATKLITSPIPHAPPTMPAIPALDLVHVSK